MYRHGDRSPVATYPKDEHRNYWKQGLGQLTEVIKRGVTPHPCLTFLAMNNYNFKYNHLQATVNRAFKTTF